VKTCTNIRQVWITKIPRPYISTTIYHPVNNNPRPSRLGPPFDTYHTSEIGWAGGASVDETHLSTTQKRRFYTCYKTILSKNIFKREQNENLIKKNWSINIHNIFATIQPAPSVEEAKHKKARQGTRNDINPSSSGQMFLEPPENEM